MHLVAILDFCVKNNVNNNRRGLPFQNHPEEPEGPLYQIWCFYPVCNDTSPKPPDY